MKTVQSIVGVIILFCISTLIAYIVDAPIIIPLVMALRFVQEVDKDFPRIF